MTLPLLPNPKQQYFDASGNPLAGGLLYTYAAGTTTPKATYQDAAGVTPNANPIILDSRGEAVIFWNGSYKVKLNTPADALIWTVDNVDDVTAIYAALLAASGGSALVGFSQGTGATAEIIQTALRRTGFYPQSYGAAADGVTDDAAAINAANDKAETANGTLRLYGTYLIKSQLRISAPIEVDGYAKIIVAADFVGGTNVVTDAALINKYFATAYNPATALPFTIEGRLEIEMRSITNRQVLTLGNINGGDIDRPYIWTNTTAEVSALIDFNSCCRNINLWAPKLSNMTGAAKGGNIWVRNNTADGTVSANDSSNLNIYGGTMEGNTGDECLAIWGGLGVMRKVTVRGLQIDATSDYTTGTRHSSLLSVFPTDNVTHVNAAIYDVLIDNVILNDSRFMDHVYKVGASGGTAQPCQNILFQNSYINAKQQTVRTSYAMRNIMPLGNNVVVDNATVLGDTTGQAITYGAAAFDEIRSSSVTPASIIQTAGFNCNSVRANLSLQGALFAVDRCLNVEGNLDLTAPAFAAQWLSTANYRFVRNVVNLTNTSSTSAAVLINTSGGTLVPAGNIEQNVVNANNSSARFVLVSGANPGVFDILRNKGIGTGSALIPTTVRFCTGNDHWGTQDAAWRQTLPGDAAVTLTAAQIQDVVYDAAITADRTITGPTAVLNGNIVNVIRTANCTGAFNVTFSGSSLAATGWMEFKRINSAWVKTGQGT